MSNTIKVREAKTLKEKAFVAAHPGALLGGASLGDNEFMESCPGCKEELERLTKEENATQESKNEKSPKAKADSPSQT